MKVSPVGLNTLAIDLLWSQTGRLYCEPYTTFNESYRREVRECIGDQDNCDQEKVDGTSWYRFNLWTGENSVLDHCPKWFTCGTFRPILMNNTHLEQYGEIKHVTMYASTKGELCYSDGSFYFESGSALVTKCSVDGNIF